MSHLVLVSVHMIVNNNIRSLLLEIKTKIYFENVFEKREWNISILTILHLLF